MPLPTWKKKSCLILFSCFCLQFSVDIYFLHFFNVSKKTVTGGRVSGKWKTWVGRLNAWELMPVSWFYDPGLSNTRFLISHRKLIKFPSPLVVAVFSSLISPFRWGWDCSGYSLCRECPASEYWEWEPSSFTRQSPWGEWVKKLQNESTFIDSEFENWKWFSVDQI